MGIEHAVGLGAWPLYEAVGLAIDRFRRCDRVPYEPQGMHEFIVESRDRYSAVGENEREIARLYGGAEV